MKFGKTLTIVITLSVCIVMGVRLKHTLQGSPVNFEQKIDKVYGNFLGYGPKFLGKYWNQTEQHFESGEGWRSYFDDEAKNYYRDVKNKEIYRWQFPDYPEQGDKYLITGADYETFTPLSMWYARDKNHIYYEGERLSFDVNKNPRRVGEFIADDEKVYHRSSQSTLTDVNSQQFRNIEGSGGGTLFYTDGNTIFLDDGSVLMRDTTDEFQVLGLNYAKNKRDVYRGSTLVAGADVDSFTAYGALSPYAHDRNNVYIGGKILATADKETFEIDANDPSRARDKNSIYENGEIVE